ncbi:MAG: tetratricopeptide repeat protein [Bradymonadales bacterium]|jgi:tetratricopeptide (TPR) repeat protein
MSRRLIKYILFFMVAAVFMACSATKEKEKPKTTAAIPRVDVLPQKKEKLEYTTKLDDRTETRIAQAVALGREGRSVEARQSLEAIIKTEPKAYAAYYNIGILDERAGKFETAAASYRRALDIEKDFTPALINLVRVELREGKNALATAESYIKKSPNNFEHQYAKLEAMLGTGRDSEAIAIIRNLLKKDEASTRLRYYMGVAEFHQGRYLLCQFVIDQALSISTQDPEIYFLKALVDQKLDMPIEAQKSVDRALELNPNYLEALWLKGIISYETRNIVQARELFTRAMAENPSIPALYLNLGNVLKTQGMGDAAEAKLKEAEKLAPRDGDVMFSLGALYLSLDGLKLKSISGMPRLKLAEQYFLKAKEQWRDGEQKKLADEFLMKTKRAEEILQAEMDAAELGADPFGADPFGDSADPFGDNAGTSPSRVD